jgi:hypothetical protein
MAWEAGAGSHEVLSIESLAELMSLQPNELTSLTRTVRRLVQAGRLDVRASSSGSPWRENLITGVTLVGQREVSGASQPVQPGPGTVNINVYGGTVGSVNLGQVKATFKRRLTPLPGLGPTTCEGRSRK